MNCGFVLIISAIISTIKCFPSAKNGIPSADAFKFMRKYGYIEETDGNSEALFTESGLENVIKNIQKFGAIPQTGQLDNDTLKLMVSPRCGVADVIRHKDRQKRFILGPAGWTKRNISFFVANWPGSLSKEEVTKYISLGLDTWARYGRLNFREVSNPDADIIVAFGSGYHGDRFPFDGPGNVLAHAFFPYEFESLGGDIHFDNDEKWTTSTNENDGINFFSVAVHELGHSLGLSHSPVASSVMFPYYTGNSNSANLDYDDILGMYELYIKRRLKGDDTNDIEPNKPEVVDDDYDNNGGYEREVTTAPPRYTTKRYTTRPSTYDPRRTTRTYYTSSPRYSPPTTSRYLPTTTRRYTPRTTTRRYTAPTEYTTKRYTQVSYHGDSESVDDHKRHDPRHNIPPTSSPSLPDICEGHYDAIANFRNELFAFKGEYIWRLRKPYFIIPGYPIPLHQMFPKLPKDIRMIDAAYERADGKIILFTGNHYWVYDGTFFVEDSPKSLAHYGLPHDLKRVDAVFKWAKNEKTYFFSNDVFWRYNETSKTMDEGYPKNMERWRGVPTHLDTATTFQGVTYFFKGKYYWRFDNDWIIVSENSPMPSPPTWFACPKEVDES